MVNYNINRYIGAIAIVTIVSFIMCLCLFDLQLWDSITYSISVASFIAVVFIKFAWSWSIFRGWLVPFPNLGGEWEGTLKSTYKNTPTEIPIKLDIKQTFMHIQIKLYSDESKSNSIVAAFNIDEDRDILQLCYTYHNNPKATLQKKSPIHYGSVILDIKRNGQQMEGQYWTSRNTTGDISIKKRK